MTPRQFAISEARRKVDAYKRSVGIAEQELALACSRPEPTSTPPAVAPSIRPMLAAMNAKDLADQALGYSTWLAQKCRDRGPGAASDSGEANVCALLDELAKRVRQ